MSTRAAFIVVMLANLVSATVATVAGAARGTPAHYFREHQPMTWLSSAQLLVIALVCYKILVARRGDRAQPLWRAPEAIWALMAAGFVFLALDESLMIHERLDKAVHHVLKLKETEVSDELDTAILALYGVIGLAVIFIYRKEFRACLRFWPYLIAGFGLAALMLAADVASDKNEILDAIVGAARAHGVRQWVKVVEESSKSFAEGMFLVGLYAALLKARGLAQSSSSSNG